MKTVKKYIQIYRIKHCGRMGSGLHICGGCPFEVGGHGHFCGHPEVEKNKGKNGIPKIPSVGFYTDIPEWCPLPDFASNDSSAKK